MSQSSQQTPSPTIDVLRDDHIIYMCLFIVVFLLDQASPYSNNRSKDKSFEHYGVAVIYCMYFFNPIIKLLALQLLWLAF